MIGKFKLIAFFALAAALILPATLFAGGAKETTGQPVKPSIIDVAGDLQLSQPAIDAFKTANPKIVSGIEYVKLTAPELVAKIKAQQMASNLVTTMVLTGYDGMAAGVVHAVACPLASRGRDLPFLLCLDDPFKTIHREHRPEGFGVCWIEVDLVLCHRSGWPLIRIVGELERA